VQSQVSADQTSKRPFTVADEIGLTLFSKPAGEPPEIHFSPDGKYFAVWSERGRLELNRVEDSVRFYRSQDVKTFLEHSDELSNPSPIWVVTLATDKEGPIITKWRWLADSTGVAFLERTEDKKRRLMLSDIRAKITKPLTQTMEDVKDFDICDPKHYVYSVVDTTARKKWQEQLQKPAIVGTGLRLNVFLFPDARIATDQFSTRSSLWVVVGRKRFHVRDDYGQISEIGDFALSSDGRFLAAKLPVADVPSSWEALYPPPAASARTRVSAGHHDLQSSPVHQYVRIELQTGVVQPLTEAPTSNDAGWITLGSPSWSNDDQAILLPGTFLSSNGNAPSRPCVAVVDLALNTHTCVETLKAADYSKADRKNVFEKDYHVITSASFIEGDKHRVAVTFMPQGDQPGGVTEYQQALDGTWHIARQVKGEIKVGHGDLEVVVKQGFDEAPILVAMNQQVSRTILDPNPQLKNLDLGQAIVYAWKDKEGRDWQGGLFKPKNYRPGLRYPLVIQTHGFTELEFRASGVFPTAMAARELASVGIVVLQIGKGWCPAGTPNEGPCFAQVFESAASQLVSEGLADPEKIGIIGFSRTCFHVMETLTAGSLHFKSASITDGVTQTYLQYMMSVDDGNRIASDANRTIGAPPFGEGLQQWLQRSPSFNLEKITTPLLVVGEGSDSLLLMWETYAGLRYLNKPVDLIMLNTDEHILTNPAVRVASQGGTVDWFRFWLKDEEDPDPTKAEQYTRWRELQKLQKANGNKQARFPSASNQLEFHNLN
jgi:dipeptidyl aminopeptidase/acylaminoacyl peptidase